MPGGQGVAGSNPVSPTVVWPCERHIGAFQWPSVEHTWNKGSIWSLDLRARGTSRNPGVSSYDSPVVSQEQIQRWADEAEAGYDVAELKRRSRGRPGRAAEPMQVVAVRLTAEELEALDAAAERHALTRSEAIRAALARYTA
jgi:uncharacterized protein (DUF4415 family)